MQSFRQPEPITADTAKQPWSPQPAQHTLRPRSVPALVLAALAMLTWVPRLRGPLDLRWDGAVYFILGTSLAEQHDYRLLNEPGNIQDNQYPPLLPLIVAAHEKVVGSSDPWVAGEAMRKSMCVLFTTFIVASYYLFCAYLPGPYPFIAALVLLLNLFTQLLSDLLFPELLFGLALVLFVLCYRKSDRSLFSALAGVIAIAAYALRTVGVALLMVWVADALFRKRWRRAVLRAAISAVPVICWMAYISHVEHNPEYKRPAYAYQRADYMFYNVSYFRNIFLLKDNFQPELGRATVADIVGRGVNNALRMPEAFGRSVSFHIDTKSFGKRFNIPGSALTALRVGWVLIGIIVIGGIVLLARKGDWGLVLLVVLSVAAICVTPWPQQFVRYLSPLEPLLIIGFALGVLAACSMVRLWRPSMVTALPYLLLGFLVLIQSAAFLYLFVHRHPEVTYRDLRGNQRRYRLFFYLDYQRTFDTALDWLRPRANTSDILACSMPQWAYVRTGLRSVMPPYEADPAKAQELLDSVPVRFLIVDDGLAVDTRNYTMPVVRKFPDKWKRIYTATIRENGEVLVDDFAIYERVQP